MLLLTRLIELLFVNRRLKTSRPYVFSALTGFAALALLGVFGTFLIALLAAGALWLIFTQLLAAGLSIGLATLVVFLISLCLLGVTAYIASHVWAGVQADLGRLIEGQAPLGAPLVDKTIGTLGNVAGAFMQGLKRKRKFGA